jgi:hypothetical protein
MLGHGDVTGSCAARTRLRTAHAATGVGPQRCHWKQIVAEVAIDASDAQSMPHHQRGSIAERCQRL